MERIKGGLGLVVTADVLVGGPFNGATMSPARAMGPMPAGQFLPGYWHIHWIGPIIGAAIAGPVYSRVRERPTQIRRREGHRRP